MKHTKKQGHEGLDEESTAQTMMDGMRIYYNFIRPHTALGDRTPSEKAGIAELSKDRWLDLIKSASGIQPRH